MPTTFPGVSVGKARQIQHQTAKLIRTIPELERVFGKMGRAETATDPAPLTMIETTIALKPRDQWGPGLTPESLRQELNALIQLPGPTNARVMPIQDPHRHALHGHQDPGGHRSCATCPASPCSPWWLSRRWS
jgi:Cu(I)/Ag(I) efflux system membrane protein CusA/SilA